MPLSCQETSRLRRLGAPPANTVRRIAEDWMLRTDTSRADMAQLIGRGRSTLNLFFQGRYAKNGRDENLLAARIWDYVARHPIEPQTAPAGRLFDTENVRRIRKYFTAAAESGEICLLYGPPGTQKTFVLEHLIAESNRAKKNDAIYVYASVHMTAMALLKRIGCAVGIAMGFWTVERLTRSVVQFLRTPNRPAIAVDEAQHLSISALEILRELHDRSGCGLILAGSHDLFENFLRGRQHLEQWLSRIDHKEPLPGLHKEEVSTIAAAELGNGEPAKLSQAQVKKIIEACRVEDVFGRDAAGKPCVRTYLSARRLVKFLKQVREERVEKVS